MRYRILNKRTGGGDSNGPPDGGENKNGVISCIIIIFIILPSSIVKNGKQIKLVPKKSLWVIFYNFYPRLAPKNVFTGLKESESHEK